MIVVTKPSVCMRAHSKRRGPQFEDQQSPGQIAENADGPGEGIPGPAATEVVAHRLIKAERGRPCSTAQDDVLGISPERFMLVHPRRSNAATELWPVEDRLRKQVEASRHVA